VHFRADRDIVLAKASTVRKCLATIRRLKAADAPRLEAWIVQDVVVLNLQRAAQACLDLANHLITANSWELPRSARHSVEILRDASVIPREQSQVMVGVMGFRNIAVHDYAALDPAIVDAIVAKHLGDLERFVDAILEGTGA
jgi:uncharacterized protein YutE (UPF0331/DUF86 family)